MNPYSYFLGIGALEIKRDGLYVESILVAKHLDTKSLWFDKDSLS